MPETTVGDVRIHYQDVGTGDPVVLLHGGMASGEYWKRAGYVDALASTYRVLLPDFRGHGRSSRLHDPEQYGVRYDVADVVAVLDHAGVDTAALCGWSWGGTIALALAALHPRRVAAVLTTGTSGRHGFSDVQSDFSRFPEMEKRIATDGMPAMAAELRRLGSGTQWLYDLMLDNDPVALAAWYHGQPLASPAGCALSSVTAPVLMLAGADEVEILNFPDVSPPNARRRVLPGKNHVTAFLSPDILVPALDALLTVSHHHARGRLTDQED